MTVAAPPPQAPQEREAVELQQMEEVDSAQFQSYRVHQLGVAPPQVDWREVVAAAETVPNAVRALAQACYEAGYPGAQVRYAIEGDDLYIAVDPGTLLEVQRPPELAPYFDSLPHGEPLRDRQLEPRRVLADEFSARARILVGMNIEQTPAGQRLILDARDADVPATRFGAAVSNPGNRFAGRYFFDLDARHVRDSGDRFDLEWRTGLSDLDDRARADEYYATTLSWSRVTMLGLFGVTAHVIDYKQPFADVRIDGDLEEYMATWSAPVAATFSDRWLVKLQIDYTRKRRSVVEGGPPLQSEQYPSIEAGMQYLRSLNWLNRDWELEAGLTLRQGVRSSHADTGETFDYFLWRPDGRVMVHISERLRGGVAIAAQYAPEPVPEQSQWVLGGENAIYAYRPGVAVGDSGALAQLQLEYVALKLDDIELRPRVFFEYAYARREAPLPGSPERVDLADAGIELNAQLRSWLEASVAGAVALDDSDLDPLTRTRSDAGVLFRVAVSF